MAEISAGKVFSNNIWSGYLDYVQKRHGEGALTAFLASLPFDPKWVRNSAAWHTADEAEQFYARLRGVAGGKDPLIALNGARSLYDDNRAQAFTSLLGVFLTPVSF